MMSFATTGGKKIREKGKEKVKGGNGGGLVSWGKKRL